MQKQKTAGEEDPFTPSQDQEQNTIKPAELKVPDIHETMKLIGARETIQGSAKKVMICCCGDESCRIGPFTVPKDVSG